MLKSSLRLSALVGVFAFTVAAGPAKKSAGKAPKNDKSVKAEPEPTPQPAYDGSLNPEDIRATIGKGGAKIGECYQDELNKTKTLRGKVHVTFVVEVDGSVAAVKVRKSTLQSPPVEECLVTHLKTLQFPKPQGEGMVIVNYPFNFNPQGAPPLENDAAPAQDPLAFDILGELPEASVTEAAAKNRSNLDKCFAEERKRNAKVAEGTLTTMYIVDKDGKVERSFLKDSTIKSARFEHCVLEQVKTWNMEKPTWGRAYVTQSLSFAKK